MTVKTYQVPVGGDGDRATIKVRVYNADKSGPVVCFYPGNLDCNEYNFEQNAALAEALTVELGYKVLVFEHRLCPGVRFLVPAEDCYQATEYIRAHRAVFEIADDESMIDLGFSLGVWKLLNAFLPIHIVRGSKDYADGESA